MATTRGALQIGAALWAEAGAIGLTQWRIWQAQQHHFAHHRLQIKALPLDRIRIWIVGNPLIQLVYRCDVCEFDSAQTSSTKKLRLASNSALHDDAAVNTLELQCDLDFGFIIQTFVGKIESRNRNGDLDVFLRARTPRHLDDVDQ